MTSNRNAWRILLLLCMANFVAYVAVFEVPPIFGDLVKHFDITYTQAGLLMTVYAIVRTIGSLMAGTFSDRYGQKFFVLAGLGIVAIAGYVSSITSSFQVMLICRTLIGIGATAIFIPGLAAAIFILPPQRVNLATGTFFSSLYIGLSMAFLLTPILAADYGWQFPIRLFAALAALVLIIFFLLTRGERLVGSSLVESPSTESDANSGPSRHYSFRNIPLVVVSAAYFLLLFQSYGMITWLPEYLKSRGYTPVEVGYTSMLLGLVMIPGSIMAGWLSDRIGAWLVGLFGAMACALCPLALVVAPNLTLSAVFADVFFLALGTSLLVVPLTSILTHLVPAKDSGKAVGLVHTTGYAGSIISTYLGGYMLTIFGNYNWTFSIYALSMLITLLLLFLLKGLYQTARAEGRSVYVT